VGRSGALAAPFDHYDCAPAFLDALDRPVVTTLHTVLPTPRADLRAAIQLLCARSAATVVMVEVGAKILVEDYAVDPGRLVVIPHGVPEVRPVDKERAKRRLRLSGRTVVCTFGLLTRTKGIDAAIRALPAVVARHPDTLYLSCKNGPFGEDAASCVIVAMIRVVHVLEQRPPSFMAHEWLNVTARPVRGGTHAKDNSPLY